MIRKYRKQLAHNVLVLCLVVMMAGFTTLTGCSVSGDYAGDGRYKIVCTTFPQYDWVKQIIGDDDRFDVKLLLGNGVDMHSYQPTVDDMYEIATADMFVYVGGSSDKWVSDALKNARNKNMKVVNMMEVIGDKAKVEELVEGMQEEKHDSHSHSHDSDSDSHGDGHSDDGHEHSEDEHDDDEELEYDEHMWLSLGNAMIITQELADNLKQIDRDNADKYEADAKEYISRLKELDNRYREAVSGAADKTIMFGDRFPFRYLADEYGLTYYAAFPGCSAETEASFETVTFLSGKADELGLKTIYVIENSDKRVAQTIVKNTKTKNQEIVTMNSMQSVSNKDIAAGVSYIGIMEDNLLALKKGL